MVTYAQTEKMMILGKRRIQKSPDNNQGFMCGCGSWLPTLSSLLSNALDISSTPQTIQILLSKLHQSRTVSTSDNGAVPSLFLRGGA